MATTAAPAQHLEQQLPLLRRYVPAAQLRLLWSLATDSEEAEAFAGQLRELAATIEAMPLTYQGDSVARLHYFAPSADWWITELDAGDGTAANPRLEPQHQAFGLARLFEDPELGYISLPELLRTPDVEIDLYWSPKSVEDLRARCAR
ncbi:MAG: DUF2958 domain-containing protein [Thermoanaerobaculia bacterium]|nr:MAG: DUF2958 domain-containing protein [Thermoanaerobaculia bacterium]MBZ0101081.1 DUF2958 domain-containing protein [Thermoanaerobaculia bacterium]